MLTPEKKIDRLGPRESLHTQRGGECPPHGIARRNKHVVMLPLWEKRHERVGVGRVVEDTLP